MTEDNTKPIGWICPVCGMGNSPWEKECQRCARGELVGKNPGHYYDTWLHTETNAER